MLTTKIPHTLSLNGYYYFSKRVPSALMHHYNYHRIVQFLRTRRNGVAKSRSTLLASQLDSRWAQLRLANADIPRKSILSNNNDLSKTVVHSTGSISNEAALKIYLKQKTLEKGKLLKLPQREPVGI